MRIYKQNKRWYIQTWKTTTSSLSFWSAFCWHFDVLLYSQPSKIASGWNITIKGFKFKKQVKTDIITVLFLVILTACSPAKLQKFKEMNRPTKTAHYRDTVINGQFIRIPLEKPPRTEKQRRKDRNTALISVGVLAVWYALWQQLGEHE